MKLGTLKRSLAALAMLTLARSAAAQPVTNPAEVPAPSAPETLQPTTGALGVEILDPDHMLDVDAVRAAIGAELGVTIVDATAFAPTLGRLEIATEQGAVRIAYHPAPGTVIERTLALPGAEGDRIQLIAFVATNLVRDQATEVMAAIPPRAAPPPPREHARTRFVPVSLGLVPPVSIDRIAGDRVTVGVGINGLVGLVDASAWASVSGLADLKRLDASGVQIGGLVAHAGRTSTGVQIGGLVAHAGRMDMGVQIGGLASVTKREMHGAQIAGMANVAGHLRGAQVGPVNVAREASGVQIGVVNVAKKMRGVQVGLVNISEDGDDSYPIGLVNYSRNGQLSLDASVDSSLISSLAVRHGSKHITNTWAIGWSPDYDHVLVGAGLGVHHNLGPALGLDVDAMHWITNVWNDDFGKINQLRATISVPVATNIELFGGAAANVYVSDEMDDSEAFHPVAERTFHPGDDTKVVIWPSAFAGIRLRAR